MGKSQRKSKRSVQAPTSARLPVAVQINTTLHSNTDSAAPPPPPAQAPAVSSVFGIIASRDFLINITATAAFALVLAIITAVATYIYTVNIEQDKVKFLYRSEALKNKQTLLQDFANAVPRTMDIQFRIQHLRIWMKLQELIYSNPENRELHTSGMKFSAVYEMRFKLHDELFKNGHPNAMAQQIQIAYASPTKAFGFPGPAPCLALEDECERIISAFNLTNALRLDEPSTFDLALDRLLEWLQDHNDMTAADRDEIRSRLSNYIEINTSQLRFSCAHDSSQIDEKLAAIRDYHLVMSRSASWIDLDISQEAQLRRRHEDYKRLLFAYSAYIDWLHLDMLRQMSSRLSSEEHQYLAPK